MDKMVDMFIRELSPSRWNAIHFNMHNGSTHDQYYIKRMGSHSHRCMNSDISFSFLGHSHNQHVFTVQDFWGVSFGGLLVLACSI